MNIILIGYRGSGKTTVAQRLGLRLGWEWVDTDVEIELGAGKSIAEIFADAGEDAFRDLESEQLTRLCGQDGRVLAVGGGAVLRPENRKAMKHGGSVVWLRAPVRTLYARIANDPVSAARRPNLTNAGGPNEIEQLLAERQPIYRHCADLKVDTEDKAPAEIAEEIMVRLHLSAASDSS